MISSAEAGLVVAIATLLAGPARAQSDVPAGLTARVATAVARTWSVADGNVRLEWGAMPVGVVLTDSTVFRLVGGGERGWFAVALEPRGHAPIAARLHAGVAESVTVAARALPAGATLGEGDITTASQVRWSAPLPATPTPVAAGWVTRRQLAAGDRLEAPAISPPPVVLANEPVRVLWNRGGVMIEMGGVALNAAALGQPVNIRINERPQTTTGVAAGKALVRIGT